MSERVWTYDITKPEPVAVYVEVFGWPNKDVHGVTQYVNTHFRTIQEAWAALLANLAAGMSLANREMERHRAAMDAAETERRAYQATYDEAVARAPRNILPTHRDTTEEAP